MWESMADVLGTAATATLLRRSIKRANLRQPGLDGVVIARDGFEYSYVVPDRWKSSGPEQLAELRGLTEELSTLLKQLTGPIVINRLNNLPELRRCDLSFEDSDDKAPDTAREHG